MKYIDFKEQLDKFFVFSTSDIRKIDSKFDDIQLTRWQEKGYIKKIIKGYYIFSDKVDKLNDYGILYYIANEIYKPSYISLESGLKIYNLIPEEVNTITSITTNKTQEFNTDIGLFLYRSIKPNLFWGYQVWTDKKRSGKIAEPEKVILDYLYLNSKFVAIDDFIELRINKDMFNEVVNRDKLKKYLKVFSNDALNERVKILLKYIDAEYRSDF